MDIGLTVHLLYFRQSGHQGTDVYGRQCATFVGRKFPELRHGDRIGRNVDVLGSSVTLNVEFSISQFVINFAVEYTFGGTGAGIHLKVLLPVRCEGIPLGHRYWRGAVLLMSGCRRIGEVISCDN